MASVSISVTENIINLTSNSQYGTMCIKLNDQLIMEGQIITTQPRIYPVRWLSLSRRDRPKSPNYPSTSSAAVSPNIPRPGKEPKILQQSANPDAPRAPFCAKQTQSQKPKNNATPVDEEDYEQKPPPPHAKKQTQSNPIHPTHTPGQIDAKPRSRCTSGPKPPRNPHALSRRPETTSHIRNTKSEIPTCPTRVFT